MAIDHTNCTHPRTPAGRKACREQRINATPEARAMFADRDAITPAPVRRARMDALITKLDKAGDGPDHREIGIPYVVWPEGVSKAGYRKMVREAGERHARKTAEKPARIQPRRGGARVAANASTCVQAALHTDANGGACACGWVAA